MITSSDI